jgi:hypothetical protein
MDESLTSRLDAALNLKAQKDQEAAEKLQAEERARRDIEARIKTATERWQKSHADLQQAVSNINRTISSHGLHLKLVSGERGQTFGLAQVQVHLSGSQGAPKKVVFNISTLGLVQPVVLIPHSGDHPPKFEISEDDVAKYEAVLVDFIDQAVKAL